VETYKDHCPATFQITVLTDQATRTTAKVKPTSWEVHDGRS
jgi:hypothetical protein